MGEDPSEQIEVPALGFVLTEDGHHVTSYRVTEGLPGQ